jgi:hypothetical protein
MGFFQNFRDPKIMKIDDVLFQEIEISETTAFALTFWAVISEILAFTTRDAYSETILFHASLRGFKKWFLYFIYVSPIFRRQNRIK